MTDIALPIVVLIFWAFLIDGCFNSFGAIHRVVKLARRVIS